MKPNAAWAEARRWMADSAMVRYRPDQSIASVQVRTVVDRLGWWRFGELPESEAKALFLREWKQIL